MGGAGGAVARTLVLARLYILTILMESRSPSFLVKFILHKADLVNVFLVIFSGY